MPFKVIEGEIFNDRNLTKIHQISVYQWKYVISIMTNTNLHPISHHFELVVHYWSVGSGLEHSAIFRHKSFTHNTLHFDTGQVLVQLLLSI